VRRELRIDEKVKTRKSKGSKQSFVFVFKFDFFQVRITSRLIGSKPITDTDPHHNRVPLILGSGKGRDKTKVNPDPHF